MMQIRLAANSGGQRLSTRLAFLAAGTGMSAWAALVPFAKTRMDLDPAELGLVLLCLGMGSLIAMPIAGHLTSRFGCRLVILSSGLIASLVLPFLAIAPTPLLLAIALSLFGAAIGTLDVSMNIQAVIVEKNHGRPLMSGFHGLFSVGGFIGAGGMALMLSAGLRPLTACVSMTAVMVGALCVATPHLLPAAGAAERESPAFAVPHGTVIFLGIVCFIVFLAEGATLDWGALLLTTSGGFTPDQGGIGYAVFAIAMTVGRLTGDRVIRGLGRKRVMMLGGLCAAVGFYAATLAPASKIALIGFLLIGVGASNIVPILFTAAGRQQDMPPAAAISAVTTLGYAGILAGPALIGFVAHISSLHVAFGGLGCAMLLVAGCSRLRLVSRTEY
jgi:predicted MFS family arabinose efflux permease